MLSFLLVPLYTTKGVLSSVAEYGEISVIFSYFVIFNVVLAYGMETAFFRFFNKEENKRFLGGVGAVANQLSALVKDVELFTYLGEFDLEENLKFAKENLSDNISLTFVVKEDSPTIKKTRFIDSYWKSRLFETYEMNDRPLEEDEKWMKDDRISKLQNSFAIDFLSLEDKTATEGSGQTVLFNHLNANGADRLLSSYKFLEMGIASIT